MMCPAAQTPLFLLMIDSLPGHHRFRPAPREMAAGSGTRCSTAQHLVVQRRIASVTTRKCACLPPVALYRTCKLSKSLQAEVSYTWLRNTRDDGNYEGSSTLTLNRRRMRKAVRVPSPRTLSMG